MLLERYKKDTEDWFAWLENSLNESSQELTDMIKDTWVWCTREAREMLTKGNNEIIENIKKESEKSDKEIFDLVKMEVKEIRRLIDYNQILNDKKYERLEE